MNLDVGSWRVFDHSPGYKVYLRMLLRKIYLECRENPRAFCPTSDHVCRPITVGAAHGNRQMRLGPSGFVLFDLPLQSGSDGDRHPDEPNNLCIGAHARYRVLGYGCSFSTPRPLDDDCHEDADKQAG